MWKKLMSITLIAIMAVVIAACGSKQNNNGPAASGSSSPEGTGSPVVDNATITWWVPNWDEEIVKRMAAEFEQQNPGIKVEFVITTWDTMENKIKVALLSGGAPDLITELESRIPAFARQGKLADLSAYVENSFGKDDIVESALEINSYDGKLYGIPYRHDGSGILYNKKLFAEAGLDPEKFPATWDEFVNAAKALTKDTDGDGKVDQYGTAWPFGNQPNSVTRFLQQLYGRGGTLLSEDGKRTTLNTPEAVEAMTALIDSISKDGYAPKSSLELDGNSLASLFISGKLGMYVTGQYDIDTIKKDNPDLELGSAVLPGPSGMGTTTVNGFSLIVPESSKHKDATWKLIAFISDPKRMAELTTTFPGLKSAMGDAKFSDPLLQPFAEQLKQGKAEPAFPEWPNMEKEIFTAMQKLLINGADVKQTMEQLNEKTTKMLK